MCWIAGCSLMSKSHQGLIRNNEEDSKCGRGDTYGHPRNDCGPPRMLALCSALGYQALSLPGPAEEEPLAMEPVINSQLCARQKIKH